MGITHCKRRLSPGTKISTGSFGVVGSGMKYLLFGEELLDVLKSLCENREFALSPEGTAELRPGR